ncbi:MAG: hypothetical protein ABW049_12645 [Spongiibacteraceae bacterium]
MVDTVSSLYKFCSLDTGLKILSSQTLRWSAPHLFEDPFELNHLSDPRITAKALLDVLLREALIMLFGPDEPTGRHNRLVNIMARWREQQKFIDEDQAQDVLRDLLGQIANIQVERIQEKLVEWRQWASLIRIASFSETADNPTCWERFADKHRGLALRFACGKDTGLPAPQRVTYAGQAPVITNQREQLELIYGRITAPDKEDFEAKLLVKGPHQRGELEWRCFNHATVDDLESDPALWYDNHRFPAHELRAVYCGIGVPTATREQLARLLRSSYPSARLYQAAAVAGRYELEFEVIGRN